MYAYITGYRQWGNRIPLAKKIVAASFLFWLGILCHRLIWYRTSNGACSPQPGAYAYFDTYCDAILISLIPTIVLIVLAILIGRSVRNMLQRKIAPTFNINQLTQNNESTMSKINSQLTIMLFLQTLVAIISFLPYSANGCYTNITATWSKSATQVAWEGFMSNLIRLLSFLFFSSPFYISILSFSSFRQQFLRSIGLIKQENNIQLNTVQSMIGKNNLATTYGGVRQLLP